MKRKISRIVASVLASVAATAAVLLPADVAHAVDPKAGTVAVDSVGFGSGSFYSVSYDGLWKGKRGGKLWIPRGDNTITATAYFLNLPTMDPVTMRVASGDIPTLYRWRANCYPPAPQIAYLTDWKSITVPVWKNWSPTMGAVGPSFATTDTITVPEQCWNLSVQVYMNPARYNQIGSGGAPVEFFDPGDAHAFSPTRDSQGRLQVFSVGTTPEVDLVRAGGTLTQSTHNRVRYYFLTCTAAREFMDTMIGLGNDASGVIKLPILDDVAPLAAGAIARAAGKSDVTVFAWEAGTSIAAGQATVVAQRGGGALEGC